MMLRDSTKIIATISVLSFTGSIALFTISLGIVSNQKEQHMTYVQESAKTQAYNESLQELRQVLAETEVERNSLSTRFVQDEEVIDLLALIETIGREQSVELTTSSLNVVPVNEYFEYIAMRINVDGWYLQVIRTLALLERLPYQAVVSNVQMRKKEDGSWGGIFEVQITKFKKYEN